MKKSFLILTSILLLLICYSCYKTEAVTEEEQAKQEQQVKQAQSSLRSGMTKADYLNLDEDSQRNFWISRLQDLLNEPAINSAQGTLVSNMITELQGMTGFTLTQNVADIANELADEFSETDFIAIFASVDNYTFSGTNTPTCSYCSVSPPTGTWPVAGLPQCNCRWTCGGSEAGPSSCVNSPGQQDCCAQNYDGFCGFFGSQPCNGHDTLF